MIPVACHHTDELGGRDTFTALPGGFCVVLCKLDEAKQLSPTREGISTPQRIMGQRWLAETAIIVPIREAPSPVPPDVEPNASPHETRISLVPNAVLVVDERRIVVEQIVCADGNACELGSARLPEVEVIPQGAVHGSPRGDRTGW